MCLLLKPISSGGQEEQLILCVRTLSTEGSCSTQCSSMCPPTALYDNLLSVFVSVLVSVFVFLIAFLSVSVIVSELCPGKTAAVCVPTCYRRAVHEKCILSDS